MVELRDYQRECLNALANYRRLHDEGHPYGGQRALVALPTGTGKTEIFAQMPRQASKRVLVIAHREELLDQAANRIQRANPDVGIGVEQADRHAPVGCQVLVGSIQTFTMSPRRLLALAPEDFSLVIVDEAHHITANSYLRLLAHFGLGPDLQEIKEAAEEFDPSAEDAKGQRKSLRAEYRDAFRQFKPASGTPYLVGFTATPSRTDGTGLEWIFDDIVFSRTIREMMEAKWLCPVRGLRVQSTADISGVPIVHGDFKESTLSNTVDTPERNTLAVQAYQDHAPGRQALVFCVDVKHAGHMLETFRSAGISSALVVGETPAQERHQSIAAYRQGDIRVLVGVMVFTEGFDAPETSCIIMARPTRSSLVYTQAIGRGTRIAPGKQDLLVLDVVDISKKTQVQTLNTLFGLPIKLRMGALNVLEAIQEIEGMETQLPLEIFNQAESLEDIARLARDFDPLRAAELEEYIQGITDMAWVKTPSGYALSVMGKGQLGIVVDLLGFADLRLKQMQEPPVTLGHFGGVTEAIRFVNEWVFREAPALIRVLDRNAHWRGDAATEKQVALLRRLRGLDGKPLPFPADITKGQASTLIDRYHKEHYVPEWVRRQNTGG